MNKQSLQSLKGFRLNPELSKSKSTQNSLQLIQNFLSKYQVTSLTSFTLYLSQIWKDLSSRSKDKIKGISRISFSHYYPLPGLISIRLFSIFDKNKDDCLSPKEFIEGMLTLFSESLEVLIRFIFSFYDFDNDNLIKREDIKVILAYVPVPSDFNAMVKVEDELFKMLEKAFGDRPTLDYNSFFTSVINNEMYGLFVPIVIFLYEKKPFSIEKIENVYKHFNTDENNCIQIKGCVTIEEVDNESSINKNNDNIDYLNRMKNHKKINSCSDLREITKDAFTANRAKRKTSYAPALSDKKINELLSSPAFANLCRSVPSLLRSSTIYQKVPINFKDILKQSSSRNDSSNNYNSGSNGSEYDDEYDGIKFTKGPQKKESDYSDSNNTCESYLYKVTSSSHRMKKMYFKLINKDLFYYKTETSSRHKGMHNLSGLFIDYDDSGNFKLNGQSYFSFSLIYPSGKYHNYYTENYHILLQWIKALNKILKIKDINDIYEIKEQIGKGKFSIVNLGIDTRTNKEYAIKTIDKKNLSSSDLELIKVEIDILKVCQHPYIVKLYDVIETLNYIYIVIEYCPGGNLFSYFEKRNFYFPEKRVADIIHKISTAVYSMHNLGIIHRDLKLSNIVMTDTTDEADIRILDFGLSKIIGPGEKCNESYGTVGYAAPEVIKENKYDYKADIWSIGVIAYFLFSGKLPFDYVSIKKGKETKVDVIYNTIHDEIKFDNTDRWKTISPEGIKFVKDLMNKDPEKRLEIKDVLEHAWIKKFYGDVIERRKSSIYGTEYSKNNYMGMAFKMYATIDGDKKTA